MSYNRMQNEPKDLSALSKPLNNGERYPPIALPPPANAAMMPTGVAATDPLPVLETGQIIIHNGSAYVVTGPKDDDNPNFVFNDQSIRKGFIRKVYGILLVQLLVTCGVIALFIYHEPTKLFVRENQYVLGVAMVANIIVMLSMACCETARRSFPLNFICLGFFTVTMSLLLGAVASRLDSQDVLIAVGITVLLVVGLSIYAIQTKYDFTAWGGVLVSCILCLFVISLVGAFNPSIFSNTAVASLGALIACFLLIYDTQLIIGGNHKYQFNPEDYIFAALTLYVDIVRIFLYVLRLVARR
ncbi:protein lifeguard 1 [Drosophila tropicalis]|uniref:protein lifeguard 1 n=1 Tax=Drosophila tropicalis TaxID=46794 RepID=UPI0035AB98BC